MKETEAGFWAMLFGFMNIFARALGGIVADKVGSKYGMRGKGLLLAGIYCQWKVWESCCLPMPVSLPMAIISMITFALFLKMSNGSTYAIVPFVNPKAVGRHFRNRWRGR
jgi:NNP family nitrate/nitrite transporter-like MFS transporter